MKIYFKLENVQKCEKYIKLMLLNCFISSELQLVNFKLGNSNQILEEQNQNTLKAD